jgi:uncharacterized protein (TIGR03000 family)
MAASPVLAQRGGHGGGFSGYGRGFYGYGRGFYGYGQGFYGYGRGYYGYGRGYSGYGGVYGYGLSFPRGFYGSGYGSSYASGSSGYVPNSTGYSASGVSGYYSPSASAAPSVALTAGYGTDLADNAAHIRMKVPADAEVWFEGVKTTQTGPVRDFVSPPLDTGKSCFYQVRTRWTENGRMVEQTRKVNVRANAWIVVDFTRPDPGPKTLSVPQTLGRARSEGPETLLGE